jgi:hypothetical protein
MMFEFADAHKGRCHRSGGGELDFLIIEAAPALS